MAGPGRRRSSHPYPQRHRPRYLQVLAGRGSGAGGPGSQAYGAIADGETTPYRGLKAQFGSYSNFNFITQDGERFIGSTVANDLIGEFALEPGYYTFERRWSTARRGDDQPGRGAVSCFGRAAAAARSGLDGVHGAIGCRQGFCVVIAAERLASPAAAESTKYRSRPYAVGGQLKPLIRPAGAAETLTVMQDVSATNG
ncbi:MAG: hypothetical protein HZY76_11720 [Anaerolineae bacterium]|nr:MAG: hypothetical protein HZY76_11720 [Anaerolineae bacterium]